MSVSLENSYFATIKKDKYSFNKTPRFPYLKQKFTIDYNDAPVNSKRSTSFGNKPSFEILHKKQSDLYPYNIEDNSHFERKKSIENSRNQIKYCRRCPPEIIHVKNEHENHSSVNSSMVKKKGPYCVIVDKHPMDSFIFMREQSKKQPDAGKYFPSQNVISKRKKSPSCKFGSAKRFNYQIDVFQRMIGPGKYDEVKGKRTKHGSFDHAQRKTFVAEELERNKNPGPQYNVM